MSEKKEWLVGRSEYKDQSFSIPELKELVDQGQLHSAELVLKVGDVWKAAEDYPELSEIFNGPPRKAIPHARVKAPPPPQITINPPEPEPDAPAPKIVIRPPAPEVEVGPEKDTKKVETDLSQPAVPPPPEESVAAADEATDMHQPDAPVGSLEETQEQSPASSPSEEDTSVQDAMQKELEKEEETWNRPAPKKRAGRGRTRGARAKVEAFERTAQALEIDSFTTEDLLGRLKYVFHPLKIFVSCLMILVALLCGGLAGVGAEMAGAGSIIVASLIFFGAFGIFQGAAAFLTRCEIEGTRTLDVIGPWFKNIANLVVNAIMAVFFLGSLSVLLFIAYDLTDPFARFAMMFGTAVMFVLMSFLFTITGGYLNAILAVEVCGLGAAFRRLMDVYRSGLKRILAHAGLMVIFSYAMFLVFFLPVLVYGVLWLSTPKFKPDEVLTFLLFGLGSAFAVAAMGTLNVYSYLWIKHNGGAARDEELLKRGVGEGEEEPESEVQPDTETEEISRPPPQVEE